MTCRECGGGFELRSRGRILAKKYCSQACQRQALRTRASRRAERHPKICRQCGTTFTARQFSGCSWSKFCGARCARAFAARDRFTSVTCAACGMQFQRRTAFVKRAKWHTCSVACRLQFNRSENHHQFRAESIGDPNRRAGVGQWKALARSIRERDKHTCRRCRRVHQSNERAYPVDHVVPWRVFEDKAQANDPSNLATLCHSCHTWKTTTVEAAYFRGDLLGLQNYRKIIGLP